MPAVTVNDLNNAQLDVNTIASVATSTAATVTDRLGNIKNTLSGMNAAVLASAAAVQGSIGYLPPVAYAAGISLTLAAQTVGYSGQTYAPILSALPFTTSGTFETAKFRLIQGVSGADLAAPGGAAIVGFDGGTAQDVLDNAKPMANYAVLRAYTGRAIGVRITTTGLAGYFQRSSTDTTSADNGGTIIVDANGRRYFRLYSGSLNVQWFGAKGNGVADDTAFIQAAINAASARPTGYFAETNGLCIYIPWGTYKITNFLSIPNNAGISFVGDGGTKSKIWQSVDGLDAFQLSGNNYRGRFKGVHITGNQGQVGGAAKALNISGSGNQIYVEDCWITLFGYGIYGNPTSDSNFTNNVIEYCLTPIYLGGVGNGYFHITGNQFYNCGPVSLGGAEQRASFEFSGTTNLLFSNNRIVVDVAMSPQNGGVFKISSVNDATFSNNIFTGLNYDGKTFVAATSNQLKFCSNTLKPSSRSQFTFTTCANVLVEGNTIAGVKNPGAIGDVLIYVGGCSSVKIINNPLIGKATLYGVLVDSASGASSAIDISGNIFDGGTAVSVYPTVFVTGSSKVKVSCNTFRNSGVNNHDFVSDTTTQLSLVLNQFDRGYSIGATTAPAVVSNNIGGAARSYLSAAPVGGDWLAGDIVYFSPPMAAGSIGAVCTASGTPGTWKNFGAIAA